MTQERTPGIRRQHPKTRDPREKTVFIGTDDTERTASPPIQRHQRAEERSPEPPRRTDQTLAFEVRDELPVLGVLIACQGPHRGEVWRIADGETFLGRSSDCEIVLARDGHASGRAIRIKAERDQFAVQNLAAEGRRVLLNERPLGQDGDLMRDGDLLTVGKSVLSFRTTRPEGDA